MKLKITKTFDFAHRGVEIKTYEAGTEIDSEDKELIDVALAEKWATKSRQAREDKAHDSAPESSPNDGAPEDSAPAE